MNALVPVNSNVEAYRASTDAAAICKEIVVSTATTIQGRKYVCVEGWQAIAIAHGCAAGARDVEKVEGGVRAIGEVRRMSDGGLIATAEGFVGEDEPTWFGGSSRGKTLPKRADYAIRAMAQTRAISRACRSAFAHVVVMMNAGLATTPAEEVPFDGFDDGRSAQSGTIVNQEPAAREKLEGPHSSKTALRTAVHAVIAKVRNAQSADEIDAIQKENIATIRQANRYWPTLLTGEPNIEEDIGLKGVVELRRSQLSTEDDETLSVLLNLVASADTLMALNGLLETNDAILAELDGAASRRFQDAFDAREAAIKLIDQATIGA